MFLINGVQQIIEAGTQQLITWVTGILPQVFLFLILLNAVTRLIGRARVEGLAERCGSNAFLRYLILPFLSAIVLGNPMAISMGRYLPERYKPAYFASASYHCHTNSGIFQHINPAELFIWLGIANGVLACGMDLFPLALRYLCAGLIANFISGYVTELITVKIGKKEGITLEKNVDLGNDKGPGRSLAEPEKEETVSAAGSRRISGQDSSDPAAEPGHDPAREKTGSEAVSAPFRSITIVCGDGGYGGPVTVTPTEDRHTVLYMTGGGLEPEPLGRILALSGMKAVNGNKETVADEEVALAIIDCGGTLRCGIYPGKGIPTVNLLATGRSGPLAKYMTADLYVSAVTSAQVSPAENLQTASGDGHAASHGEGPTKDIRTVTGDGQTDSCGMRQADEVRTVAGDGHAVSPGADNPKANWSKRLPHLHPRLHPYPHPLLKPAATVSRIISIFHQSARDAVRTCLDTLLPFMGFAALFVGICRGSGLTAFLASLLKPAGGSLPGLMGLGIICSFPGLSAILGAGAVSAQMFSTMIGDLIGSGSIPPAMALPALFAINCQCACDFIPVGLGMTEAKEDTTRIGITAVTLSRFATGWIRILIALAFSIGLYR